MTVLQKSDPRHFSHPLIAAAIAEGIVPGYSAMLKFGRNVGVGTTFEDIWDQGGNYTFMSTAAALYISSSNNGDAVDVEVQGLDADWAVQTVTQTLAGQTKTEIGSGLTWRRVFRAKNVGASQLAGDVYVYEDDTVVAGVPQTASKIKAKVAIGYDQTQMAIYTIPAGYTGYMVLGWATVVTNKLVDVELMAREFGGAWRNQMVIGLSGAANSTIIRPFPIAGRYPEKTDLRVKALVDATTGDVSAGFDLLLKQNSSVVQGI